MGFINAIAGSSRAALVTAPTAPLGATRHAGQAASCLRIKAVTPITGSRRGFFGSSQSAAPTEPTVARAAPTEIAATPAVEALSANVDALEAITPAALGIIDTFSLNLLSSPFSAGATIILLTFLVRGCVTFPVSVWQRRRAWRTREKVQPEMKRLNEVLAVRLAREMRKEGKGWDEYKAELKSQLAAHQLALHKKYNTHPLVTLITPLAVHVPILVTLSLTIRGALDASPAVLEALGQTVSNPIPLPGTDTSLAGNMSPWMGQSFWWLPNLAEPDASVMLPIVGGVVAMINAEMAGRKAKKVEGNEGEVEEASPVEDTTAQGTTTSAVHTVAASPASTSATSATRPRPAAPSRLPRPALPLHPTSTPALPSRPFSSTPSNPANTPNPAKKSYKRAPAQYVSPTLAQARQKQRAEAAAKSGHLTGITPEQELRKEKDKASLRQRFMTNVLRGAAVVFVPFAAQVPAALALYWTTSMVFTMGQNALLDKMDERRKASQPLTDGT